MSVDVEHLTAEQNNLYRDKYRRTLGGLLIMIVVCLGLSGILAYMVFTTPKSKFYATTTTGRVIPLKSLSMPVVTNKYLLQWAALAVRSCYNLTFDNYSSQLRQASSYFTTTGWSALMSAMKKSGVIDSLKNNKLLMSAVVDGHPVILNEQVVHDRYTWSVQLPLLVSYTSANEHKKSKFIVRLNIMRVPVLDTAKGILINKVSVERR